jgi:hypothetical protein
MNRTLLQQAYLALKSAANNQGNIADYKDVAYAIERELAKQEFYPDWDMIKPYHERIAELEKELAKPQLRRGDVLRCAENNELCIVWTTSTSGKTLVKWGGNDFGAYTAEQIGELFWLEPKPEQEPQFAPVGEIRSSVWAGHNWAHHFNAEAKLDFKTKLYIKLEH